MQDKASLRKSYWDVEDHVAQTEADARIQLSLYSPSEFVVINSKEKGRLGNSVGYKLITAGNAASLLSVDDPPQMRAAFTNNQVGCFWSRTPLAVYHYLEFTPKFSALTHLEVPTNLY